MVRERIRKRGLSQSNSFVAPREIRHEVIIKFEEIFWSNELSLKNSKLDDSHDLSELRLSIILPHFVPLGSGEQLI